MEFVNVGSRLIHIICSLCASIRHNNRYIKYPCAPYSFFFFLRLCLCVYIKCIYTVNSMLVHKIRNKFIYTETISYFHFCYKSILVLIISYTSIDFGVWNGLRLSRHKFPDSHTRKCYLVRSISGSLVGQHWLTHTIACITINIKTLNRWAMYSVCFCGTCNFRINRLVMKQCECLHNALR